MWSDPAVREHAAMAPQHMAGMTKVLELVQGLIADATVQQRIEQDTILRGLWSDPAVRRRMQPGVDR
jgi:hypothetical protein